ncbi:general substrate transporter [Zychaea mexicana]|uniref:general substrate transporter n=1 Tax=Zychaea mexicana TaxID=64656 RepID=UPI0022FEC820|nr:general substrate transporter [Zychaea mexicana]KAI9484742.1 general substrate transporter [Zychaea mexicana]
MVLQGERLFAASTLMAAVAFLLFGYDQGVMSGVVANDRFIEWMGNPSPGLMGAIVAIYEIGCFAGALSTGRIGDILGRIKTIRLGCTILVLGAVMQTASINIAMMIVARTVTGVGNGINTATIPVYQSELSPPSSRGKGVAFSTTVLVVGVALAYWLEYGLYFVHGDFAWRFPLAFQMVFGLLLIVASYFLPESPRWLQAQGRETECKQVLARLWSGCDIKHPRCLREWEEIRDGIEVERHSSASYRELFSKGKHNNRYRVLLSIGGQLIQQFSGINVISYYITIVFENFMPTDKAMLMTGVDGIVYIIGATSAIYTIDRLGRRKLMYIGLLGQAVTLALVGACQALVEQGGHDALVPAVIIFMIIYNFVFGATWLSLAWLYPSEVFSTLLRAKGNSLSTGANWIGNFIVAEITPILFQSVGYWTFLIFSFANVLFLLPVVLYFPETRGKSLEEIETLFAVQDEDEEEKTVAVGKKNSTTTAISINSGHRRNPSPRLDDSVNDNK